MRDQPTTRHVLAAVVALVWVASASSLSAQGHPPARDSSVTFPGTPIGKLGQALIEAINGGDSVARYRFVTDHVTEAAIKDIPIADRVEWLARVSEQSGGLEVLEATGSQPLEIHVKTRRGRHWARIYAFADPQQNDRLGDYGAVPLRDPAIDRADQWSQRRLSESELVAEIGPSRGGRSAEG